MKTAVKRGLGEYLRLAMIHYSIMALYHLTRGSYRVMYGFRLLGTEHIPADGPAIIVPSDSQSLGAVLAQGIAQIGLLEPFFRRENSVLYMHEQLAFKVFSRFPMRTRLHALRPQSSVALALGLIDGYRKLRKGGAAIIAPEGDNCWDGKNVRVRDGCLWLGLRTAAPLVLFVPTAGAYDIWPFWQSRPKLSGRMDLIVSEPFQLAPTPLATVSEEDLATARALVQARIDTMRFGQDGVAGWQGQPTQNSQPVAADVTVRLRDPSATFTPRQVAAKHKGLALALLLFQCPLCGTNDAIAHRRRPFSAGRVACEACGATWRMRRIPGQDFRLTLIRGPEELKGARFQIVWGLCQVLR